MELDRETEEAIWAPHRRPTFPVDAPALVRHVMVRVPDDLTPYLAQSETEYGAARRKLVTAVNAYLDRIQPSSAPYRPRFVMRNAKVVDPKIHIRDTDTLFLRLAPAEGARLGVRLDIHNEYLTITFIADSIDAGQPLGNQVVALLRTLSGSDLSRADADAGVEYLYDGFWRAIEAVLPAKNLLDLPGTLLADYRGFIVCAPDIAVRMSRRPQNNLELRSSRLADRLQRKIDYDVFQFVKRRPLFFGTALGLEKHDETETNSPANVPISGVLDGAAIYGSSLRTQSAHANTPLRYFVVYNANSQSQLGRLVRRLHVLGELRIAALMDMPGLLAANRSIRALAYEVDKTEESAAQARSVEDLSIALARVNRGKSTAKSETGDTPCRGGAIYRVERSRHYARSYVERLQDLRIVRIEGWQPYDAFMRRNLFMEFDYISQIGNRFEAVGHRIQRLQAREQARRFEAYSQATKAATEASVIATRELVRLYQIAELVGVAAFTYYFGHVAAAWIDIAGRLPLWLEPVPGQPSGPLFGLVFALYGISRWALSRVLPSPGAISRAQAAPIHPPGGP